LTGRCFLLVISEELVIGCGTCTGGQRFYFGIGLKGEEGA
jgi:hypothetical protein